MLYFIYCATEQIAITQDTTPAQAAKMIIDRIASPYIVFYKQQNIDRVNNDVRDIWAVLPDIKDRQAFLNFATALLRKAHDEKTKTEALSVIKDFLIHVTDREKRNAYYAGANRLMPEAVVYGICSKCTG